MLKAVATPSPAVGHDEDFHAWTQAQAQLLRERRFAELDLANLVEEVESVGRSEKREIRSRLDVLLAHLLKWAYQPDARKPGWTATIFEQRQAIAAVVEDSPSLKRRPAEVFEAAYRSGRLLATKETGIAFALFPATPPFTLEQALDLVFLPDEPGLAP